MKNRMKHKVFGGGGMNALFQGCLSLSLGVGLSLLARAESGTFTNRSSAVDAKTFGDTSQWAGEAGGTVSSLPYSTTGRTSDTMTLVDLDGFQDIRLPGSALNIGTLIAPSPLRTMSLGKGGAPCFIGDPTGFLGLFAPQTRGVQLESESTVAQTPTFAPVQSVYGVRFSNTGAANDGVMRVKEVFGGAKIGINERDSYTGDAQGTVEIEKAGPNLSVFVSGGQSGAARGGVAFRGQVYASAALPGEPWLHLDATAESSLVRGEDGAVSKWADVRGEGHPFADRITRQLATNVAEMPTVKSVDGKPFVDFGANQGRNYADFTGGNNDPTSEEVARFGKPAALKLSAESQDVRDVFYVFQETQRTNAIPWVLGNYESANFGFARGELGQLFSEKSCAGVRTGRVAVDGVRVPHTWTDDWSYRPHLVSIGGSTNMAVSALAICGHQVGGTYRTLGGVRIGELLVYTNKLSDAEVAQVERYLLNKWIPTKYHPTRDLDLLSHQTTEVKTTLTVNGTGTFAIRDIRFNPDQAELVKDGDGTLVVDRVTPQNLPVTVKGGAVEFRKLDGRLDAETAQPAADPYLWLDASQAEATMQTECVEYADGTTTNRVLTWRDVRPEQTAYAATVLTEGKAPIVVPNAQNGLSVVDFGPQVASKGGYAAFKLSDPPRPHGGSTGVRQCQFLEGFVVYRKTDENAYALPIAAQGQRLGASKGVLCDRSTSSDGFMAANWRQNGVPLNYQDHELLPKLSEPTAFAVYSVAAATRTLNDLVGELRIGGLTDDSLGGGGQVAEIIYYSRRLTAAERRDTEAYLMRKWLGRPHPEAADATRVPTLTFADGVEPVVAADTDLVVSNLVLSESAFAKKGAGKVSVPAQALQGIDCDVREGSLTLSCASIAPERTPVLRFDASAESTVESASDGVTRWRDADGRLFAAQSDANASGQPAYGTSDGSDGLLAGSRFVDFGDYREKADGAIGARMLWRKTKADGTDDGKLWNEGKLQEVHCVIAKSGPTMPFGDASNISTEGHVTPRFTRSGNALFNTSRTERGYRGATNVWCLVDGDYAWRNNAWSADDSSDPGTTFHVVSLVVRNGWKMRGSCLSSDWAGNFGGGMKMAEAIFFEGTNSTLAAQAIHAHLLKKWRGLGNGRPQGEVKLGAVTVADGATLASDSDLTLSFRTISGVGAGAFRAAGGVALEDGGTLAVSWLSPNRFSAVAIDGTFVCPRSATVRLDGITGRPLDELVGDHLILTAGAFGGTESVRAWKVDDAGLLAGQDARARVRLRADGIHLTIRRRPGLAVIIR